MGNVVLESLSITTPNELDNVGIVREFWTSKSTLFIHEYVAPESIIGNNTLLLGIFTILCTTSGIILLVHTLGIVDKLVIVDDPGSSRTFTEASCGRNFSNAATLGALKSRKAWHFPLHFSVQNLQLRGHNQYRVCFRVPGGTV